MFLQHGVRNRLHYGQHRIAGESSRGGRSDLSFGKKMDTYRIANAFQQAAIDGHYEQCSNIIQNFAHVYREDYRDVLSMVSVMLMDPTGFTADEYRKINTAIRKRGIS